MSMYERLTLKEIKAELDNVHSISVPAFVVYNWVTEFKRGHTSICDASRSRHPRDIQLRLLPEITDKVYDIVLTDR